MNRPNLDVHYPVTRWLAFAAFMTLAVLGANSLRASDPSYDAQGTGRRPLVIVAGVTEQLPTADYVSTVGGITTNATGPSGAGDLQTTTETATTATIGTANITTDNVTTATIGTAGVTTANITTDNATTANITTANVGQVNYTSQSSTVTGTNSNVALNANTTVFYWNGGASAGTITGWTGGTPNRMLLVINTSPTRILTLSTLTGSSAGNQIQNLGPSTTNLRLVGSEGSSALYVYVGTAGAGVWQLVSFSTSTIDASLTFGNSTVGTTFVASSGVVTQGRNSHFRATIDTPNATTCGTSPVVNSTDAGGEITIGTTSGGNCTVTFNVTYTNPPACQVRFHDATTNNAISYSTTATTLAITGASDGKVFDFFCIGNN